jgi:hypothetical protein
MDFKSYLELTAIFVSRKKILGGGETKGHPDGNSINVHSKDL